MQDIKFRDITWPREWSTAEEIITDPLFEYSWRTFWDKLGEAIPTLSEEEKARIISLLQDTCPHCHAANMTCYCNNDD